MTHVVFVNPSHLSESVCVSNRMCAHFPEEATGFVLLVIFVEGSVVQWQTLPAPLHAKRGK